MRNNVSKFKFSYESALEEDSILHAGRSDSILTIANLITSTRNGSVVFDKLRNGMMSPKLSAFYSNTCKFTSVKIEEKIFLILYADS